MVSSASTAAFGCGDTRSVADLFTQLLAGFGGAGITSVVPGIVAVGGGVLGGRVATGASRRTGLGGAFAADSAAAGRSGAVGPARRMGFAVTVG